MDRIRLSKLKGSLDTFLMKRKKKSLLFNGLEKRKEFVAFQELLTKAITKHVEAVVTESVVADAKSVVEKADEALNKKILAILRKSWKPFNKFLSKEKTLNYLIWSGEKGGQAAADLMGVDGSFKLKNSKLVAQLEKRTTFLLDSMDETTLESVRVALVNGISKDLTISEIQTSIHAKFQDEISPYRAEMITRTEFANAATVVSKETYTKNGVEQWQWIQPAGDDDDVCTENDGEIVDIGDTFPSGDDRPPAHPNCKCDVIPVLPKDFDTTDAWLGN